MYKVRVETERGDCWLCCIGLMLFIHIVGLRK